VYSFARKTLPQRQLTILRTLTLTVRPQDVTSDTPLDVSNLHLRSPGLPSVLWNEDVQLEEVRPLLTDDAWIQLQQAVAVAVNEQMWLCESCLSDLAADASVECSACLQWYHFGCVGYSGKGKGHWFCAVCLQHSN